MLQLKNETPYKAALDLFYDENGIDTLIITVKAVFTMDNPVQVSDRQEEPVKADEYWTEPGTSSIKQGADVTLLKPFTDIIMTGHACAPGRKLVNKLDVSLTIGSIDKTVKVFGDRVWKSNGISLSPSNPDLFETMPLVYERAYGGIHSLERKTLSEPRNPVGQGFKGKQKKRELEGLPVPNIEDPKNLITIAGDTPNPQGFGWLAPNWKPRASYVGTYDDAWEKTRAPYLPDDFDLQFYQAAHPDLIYPKPITGGEEVTIKNMSPDGKKKFKLPAVDLNVQAKFKNRTESLSMKISTMHFQPNNNKFSVVWHSALNVDKERLGCQLVTISTNKC
jgi:hypothetical protein